jgi:hypothetical protein
MTPLRRSPLRSAQCCCSRIRLQRRSPAPAAELEDAIAVAAAVDGRRRPLQVESQALPIVDPRTRGRAAGNARLATRSRSGSVRSVRAARHRGADRRIARDPIWSSSRAGSATSTRRSPTSPDPRHRCSGPLSTPQRTACSNDCTQRCGTLSDESTRADLQNPPASLARQHAAWSIAIASALAGARRCVWTLRSSSGAGRH